VCIRQLLLVALGQSRWHQVGTSSFKFFYLIVIEGFQCFLNDVLKNDNEINELEIEE